jgi:glycosyltransferase involved in cell wall biosynthesis/GT2 family glycosyltransferase
VRRPTVLHVVEHWGRPSESFVLDAVRSTTATRAVVAAQHRVAGTHVPGVRVHDLSWCHDRSLPDADLEQQPPTRAATVLGRAPRGARQVHVALAGIAVAERAAVLHSHFGLPSVATWRAARRIGRPFSVALHGWDVLVAAPQDETMRNALAAASLVVVPSRFLATAAVAQGARAERVRVVPSGLDLAALPFRVRSVPTDRPPVVTFAGRFVEKKGVLDAARALAAVAAVRPVRGVFVGYGPQDAALRDLVRELRLDVEIRDGREPGAVRRALADTDLVLTASRTSGAGDAETLGLVNLEALACGALLVTTGHGATPESVPAEAVELVPEDGDMVTGLARALLRVLDSPEQWPARSRAGRAHVAARFELGSRVADLERLWTELARGGTELWVPDVPEHRPSTRVVLVTHNRKDLLRRTLDSIEGQTLAPDSVVVVDNGSTDGTAELLAERVATGSPSGLRVLTREGNLPVAEGRNLAVEDATEDLLAFTDDDCRPRPTWLEALVAGMRDGVDLVQGRTTADPAQPLERLSRTQWTPAEFGLYETCNIAYRRTAFAAAGGFDLELAASVAKVLGPRWGDYPFGEDTDLGWRVKRSGASSAFAVHAVVDHEVSPPDRALLVRRASLSAAFPLLAQRVPELRRAFLTRRVFLGPHRVRLWLALLGAGASAATGTWWPLVAVVPYVDDVFGLRRLHRRIGRRAALRDGVFLIRKDAVETAALVRGSARARSLVL